MMNKAEQEHADFVAGAASELQNSFTEASGAHALRNSTQAAMIAEALAAGLFVVVSDSPYFCKATDALVGTIRYYEGGFTRREDADAYAAQENDRDPENRFSVLPTLPVESAPKNSDEIPF